MILCRPQSLQLNKASKLHDACDLPVVDVSNRGLLRWRPVHMFVLPPVRVLLLVFSGAGRTISPSGRFVSSFPTISVSMTIAVSGARPGT